DVFAGKKSAQIREILISESAWEEMTCLFAPSLDVARVDTVNLPDKSIRWMLVRVSSTKFVLLVITI
ncbi:hypothetical protein DMW48_08360, partial [Serratia marcescens]